MQIHHVLLATDFSKSSDAAQQTAMELATRFDARFSVFHALELPLQILEPFGAGMPDAFLADSRTNARKQLQQVMDDACSRGLDASCDIGDAPAPLAIAEHVRKIGADLVVVGTEGHTGLQHLVLGSVAEGTVRNAPCSVLASRGGLVSGTGPVVVGVDFSEPAGEALQGACEIADRLGADLHLVHAANTARLLPGPYGAPPPVDFFDVILGDAKRQLAEVSAGCTIRAKLTSEVSTAPPQHALAEVARKRGARLVVVGSRGLTGIKHLVLGSVAERTVRHAPCSVWTVRPTH